MSDALFMYAAYSAVFVPANNGLFRRVFVRDVPKDGLQLRSFMLDTYISPMRMSSDKNHIFCGFLVKGLPRWAMGAGWSSSNSEDLEPLLDRFTPRQREEIPVWPDVPSNPNR